MQCLVDTATLLMSERQGVEIDYCPQRQGVWLDRGELDQLIQRSDDDWDDDDRDRLPVRDCRGHYQPKKKKRWLSEMFEFD